MRRLTEERGVDHLFEIDSAGIGAWHVGQLPDKRMRDHGALRGYLFNHRARQVRREDFDRFDFIFVFSAVTVFIRGFHMDVDHIAPL